MMADTWNIDITHFLDAEGTFRDLPLPARKLAEYFGLIISIATSDGYYEDPPTMRLCCRRRPNHQPCSGEIAAIIDPNDNHIYWCCPICGDQGVIHHWEETLWDCRDDGTVH
ncbi:MAG: hypothetical protein R8J84_04220 [Mariprofundales bacterium]